LGVDPLSITLAAGMAGLSFAQADANNDAARRAAEQQKAANRVASNKQKENLSREFAQLEGSLRATSAGRGVSGSATAMALQQTAGYAGVSAQGAVNTNLRLANQQADQQASAAYQSPLLAGVQGGFQLLAWVFSEQYVCLSSPRNTDNRTHPEHRVYNPVFPNPYLGGI
jgi:hypothetical protein